MRSVRLDPPSFHPRVGFDAWDRDGHYRFRTLRMGQVFSRRARYFRVNMSGRVFEVVNRFKTVEVAPSYRAETVEKTPAPLVSAPHGQLTT